MEDYTAIIQARIQQAVLDNYKASAAFNTAYNNLLTSLGATIPELNVYENAAVNKGIGITPEVAMECFAQTVITGVN